MRRQFAFFLLSALCLNIFGQRCLTSEGEVFAHGVRQTGIMPPALQQLIGQRSWSMQDEGRGRRAPSRMMRALQVPAPQKIEPLLQSIRAQEAPYNLLCPRWTYADGRVSEERCLSGCVATSIEQILAYYQYPEALKDTLHGWSTDNYVIEDMLPGTKFDWDNYLLDYRNGWTEQQGLAIALPTLAAGMAVQMNYGLNSSGANVFTAVAPLKDAFGYGMVHYSDRILYTPERWHQLLQYELQQGRPIAYVGHIMQMGGHAFNIDGVDEQGYYHVNWGYNGFYDGWYDLDWLNPWEPTDYDYTTIPNGFFCNQGALLMHPSSEARILETDTLDIDNLGVELQEVKFLRSPATRGLVGADFRFKNNGDDAVTYTYEVMSYLPTDTAIFYQADYLALSAITIAPQEERWQRVYLTFTKTGDRILGISHDDVTIPFTMPISVEEGEKPVLEWGELDMEVTETESSDANALTYDATFTIPVKNQATGGVAGNMITYCLFEGDEQDGDTRHYHVLNLPAGEEQTLTVSFRRLKPNTQYRFALREPWTIRAEVSFTTPIPVGIETLEAITPAPQSPSSSDVYDLSGRAVSSIPGRVLIHNGKKHLLTH